MPRSPLLAAALLVPWLASCTPPEHTVIGEPVPVDPPARDHAAGPRLTEGAGGRLVLSWMERRQIGHALRYAVFGDGEFGPVRDLVVSSRMFVNWADLPSVMHVRGEHWIAHWLQYSADLTYAYDVIVAQSRDDGRTWGEIVPAHTDGTPTEHGFVSMHREPDGVALLWLDGRDTAAEPGDDVLATSMTLRSAVITPDGRRIREQLVDDSVCDCCQTDVAVSSAGPIAVYRDRTAEEVRDIYVTRLVDGRWQAGRRIVEDNWVMPGCPVNGPSIVARGERVAIAWFTAVRNDPVVRVVISDDAGASFSAPIEIARGELRGYVGLALLEDGSLAVSWVGRQASGNNVISLRCVDPDGRAGPIHRIGESSRLRVLPQIGYQDGNLLAVWTDGDDDVGQLQAVLVPIDVH